MWGQVFQSQAQPHLTQPWRVAPLLGAPARCAGCPMYMPTWSLQELQACRELLYPAVAADTAAARYAWLGGSIRQVLVKTELHPQDVVRAAVYSQSAEQLVRAVSKSFTWQSSFPHSLGHFQVNRGFRALGCVVAGETPNTQFAQGNQKAGTAAASVLAPSFYRIPHMVMSNLHIHMTSVCCRVPAAVVKHHLSHTAPGAHNLKGDSHPVGGGSIELYL